MCYKQNNKLTDQPTNQKTQTDDKASYGVASLRLKTQRRFEYCLFYCKSIVLRFAEITKEHNVSRAQLDIVKFYFISHKLNISDNPQSTL